MGYDLSQDEAVHDQEEQSSEPDEQEGVLTFKLQEVGRAQPYTLRGEKTCLIKSFNSDPQKMKQTVDRYHTTSINGI